MSDLLRQIKDLNVAQRKELIDIYHKIREQRNETLLRAIVNDGRYDVLCKEILGIEVTPWHIRGVEHQRKHNETLLLGYRGFGKTTTLTIPGIVEDLILDPNCTILIGGINHDFSKRVLGDVKRILTSPKFVDIFGQYKGKKWSDQEIIVKPRTEYNHVPSINTIGLNSAAVGLHYKRHRLDDLIDEDSSKSQHMRESSKTFYYKEVYPTLLPGGKRHIVGTRWHPQDVYGHISSNELKDKTFIIPALIASNTFDPKTGEKLVTYESPWPARHPVERFLELRKVMPPSIFNSQYLCVLEGSTGDIFNPEWFDEDGMYYRESDIPPDAKYYGGVDLAISKGGNFFCVVIVAYADGVYYVVDYWRGHLSFHQQKKKIVEYWDEYEDMNLIRFGIESNAYQAAQADELTREYPRVNVLKIQTQTDKVSRAQRRSDLVEQHRLLFKRNQVDLLDSLMSLRHDGNGEWDLFDALDFAIHSSEKKVRARRQRKQEPGLLRHTI